MVADLVFDRILAWVGKDHAPRLASIFAAPQCRVGGINYIPVLGVKSEAVQTCKQIEHAPGIAIVMGNVAAGHIAMFEYQAGIERTYGGRNHGAASAWADDLPGVKTGSLAQRGNQSGKQEDEDQIDLSQRKLRSRLKKAGWTSNSSAWFWRTTDQTRFLIILTAARITALLAITGP